MAPVEFDPTVRIRNYREGALTRGIEFSLTEEMAGRLLCQPCHYCGWHPKHKWNGIDRVDNKAGYTPENCVSCCRWCNMAKGRQPVEDFLEWLRWVEGDRPLPPPTPGPKVLPLRSHNVIRRYHIRAEQVEYAIY